MPHFYERNIVEIKNEYTTFLTSIITPFIYEGMSSVYEDSIKFHEKLTDKGKIDPDTTSPGILKIFQTCLKEIPSLAKNSIEAECARIKEKTKCAEWFDDLVRAVIKSNIILLTYSASGRKCKLVEDRIHDNIDIHDFIHKCYIQCARAFYNSPELFWHEFSPLEIKRNQRDACNIIKSSIAEAIRKMLPIKLILMEYLKNDYIEEDPHHVSDKIQDSQYRNVRSLVTKDLHGGFEEFEENWTNNYGIATDEDNQFKELSDDKIGGSETSEDMGTIQERLNTATRQVIAPRQDNHNGYETNQMRQPQFNQVLERVPDVGKAEFGGVDRFAGEAIRLDLGQDQPAPKTFEEPIRLGLEDKRDDAVRMPRIETPAIHIESGNVAPVLKNNKGKDEMSEFFDKYLN